MGSIANVEGEIRVEPPLKWAEYRGLPVWLHTLSERQEDGYSGFCIYLEEHREDVQTDDGPLNRRTVSVIRPWPRPIKVRDLVSDVQTVLDTFPDREFSGTLLVTGDEFGDIWRVVVERDEDGKHRAYDQCPKITWPDGSETEPHHAFNMQTLRYDDRPPR